MNTTDGPHNRIECENPREQFLAALLDALWERYRERVEYVRTYENVVAQAGGTFVNDHIALRTFAWQDPTAGIVSLSRIFKALDYVPAGTYSFPDKHLSAVHLEHPQADFPKVFISELKTWELSKKARDIIGRTLASHRSPLDVEVLATLRRLEAPDDGLLQTVLAQFHELPWSPPKREDVEQLNNESQYAAWVLVHGANVNHFTSLINSHETKALDDIEKTIAALKDAGVPMKPDIEGERGSILRQSATQAAVIDVETAEGPMPWTYAYFELAERGEVTDPATGQAKRFEGFLGPQATQLFEMTRKG